MQTLFFFSLIVTVLASIYFFPDLGSELISNVFAMFAVSFFFGLSIYLFWNQDILRRLKYFTPYTVAADDQNPNLKNLDYITTLVYNQKIFKNQENNLSGISKRIGIPKNELSNLINTEFPNFNTWINGIKVQYGIELMRKSYLKDYSVEALALECGFNSKNTFYRAFKTKTGQTPTAFMKTEKNK